MTNVVSYCERYGSVSPEEPDMKLNNVRPDLAKPLPGDSFCNRGRAHAPALVDVNVSPVHEPCGDPSYDDAGSSAGAHRSRPHGVGFWLVGGAFLVSMGFSAAPAPLYPLYEHRDGFGSFTVTIVFAVYAVGVITGLLAQFAPAPLRLPYIVFAGILVLCMLGVSRAPETVEIALHRPRYRPQRPNLGLGDVTTYITAAGGAITATAIFALFISLAPGFVAGTLHHPSRALAGVILFLVFGAATVTQTALARVPSPRRQYIGAGIEATGLIILAIAMRYPNLATFLIGGVLAVGGAGILFKSALSTVSVLATSSSRGGALAGFYFIAYLGLTVPTLGLGIATQYFSAPTCVLWFSLLLLSILALITVLNRTQPPRRETARNPTV